MVIGKEHKRKVNTERASNFRRKLEDMSYDSSDLKSFLMHCRVKKDSIKVLADTMAHRDEKTRGVYWEFMRNIMYYFYVYYRHNGLFDELQYDNLPAYFLDFLCARIHLMTDDCLKTKTGVKKAVALKTIKKSLEKKNNGGYRVIDDGFIARVIGGDRGEWGDPFQAEKIVDDVLSVLRKDGDLSLEIGANDRRIFTDRIKLVIIESVCNLPFIFPKDKLLIPDENYYLSFILSSCRKGTLALSLDVSKMASMLSRKDTDRIEEYRSIYDFNLVAENCCDDNLFSSMNRDGLHKCVFHHGDLKLKNDFTLSV